MWDYFQDQNINQPSTPRERTSRRSDVTVGRKCGDFKIMFGDIALVNDEFFKPDLRRYLKMELVGMPKSKIENATDLCWEQLHIYGNDKEGISEEEFVTYMMMDSNMDFKKAFGEVMTFWNVLYYVLCFVTIIFGAIGFARHLEAMSKQIFVLTFYILTTLIMASTPIVNLYAEMHKQAVKFRESKTFFDC